MATILRLPESRPGTRQDRISDYCQDLFAHFARSDQRRWGEVYLRGLLHVRGRKTPVNISEQVLGTRTVQPLQQFISQSTWEYTTVRRNLAERLGSQVEPQAWAFDEVVFPKHGAYSAGVARQFVPSLGKVVNCQLGLATSLVHRSCTLPVNWHLLLPRQWDNDERLRAKAHIPAEERHRPRWTYLLESVDQMLQDWDVPPAPVLADWRFEPDVSDLLCGLEHRGLGYLIQVGASTRLPVQPAPGRTVLTPVGDLVRDFMAHGEQTVLEWCESPGGRARPSRFQATRLPSAGVPRRGAPYGTRPLPRHLVVEWPFGRQGPRTYWVTDLPPERLPRTVELAELRSHASAGCDRLRDYGLSHFEGRSFRGWHHHVTLASAARGFHALGEFGAARARRAESGLGLFRTDLPEEERLHG
ncbi:IS701 family transposase [Streptomyces sp. NPDC096205]|uniref:IS701 family transposase n=1 Tax=Streptomyces sp. NPDC096205 TaxID=3366081 RepID=UPI00381F811A